MNFDEWNKWKLEQATNWWVKIFSLPIRSFFTASFFTTASKTKAADDDLFTERILFLDNLKNLKSMTWHACRSNKKKFMKITFLFNLVVNYACVQHIKLSTGLENWGRIFFLSKPFYGYFWIPCFKFSYYILDSLSNFNFKFILKKLPIELPIKLTAKARRIDIFFFERIFEDLITLCNLLK